jgi:hypothetical protein
MNLNSLLKLAVISQWVFVIICVVARILEEKYLPVNLAEYAANLHCAKSSMVEIFIAVIDLIFFFAYFVSSIGLLFKKCWAPKIYLFSNMGGLLIMGFLFRIKIITPLSDIFSEISTALIGFTICLIYFSPLKEEFKSTSITSL